MLIGMNNRKLHISKLSLLRTLVFYIALKVVYFLNKSSYGAAYQRKALLGQENYLIKVIIYLWSAMRCAQAFSKTMAVSLDMH